MVMKVWTMQFSEGSCHFTVNVIRVIRNKYLHVLIITATYLQIITKVQRLCTRLG